MCLSCQYGHYRNCGLCKVQCCREELYGEKCILCFKNMTKKRRCRTCGKIFPSGNELFVHLNQNATHKKDYSSAVRNDVMKNDNKICNTWMEEYVYVGFLY